MAWTNAPTVVYHGTIEPSAFDIASTGIDIRKCKPINDFGLGFYVTTSLDQAKEKANMRYRTTHLLSLRRHHFPLSPSPGSATVLSFIVDRLALGRLNSLVFIRPDADWADFISHCRSNGRNHYPSGPFYDVVYGPVSLTRGVKPDSDQISFHTPSAIAALVPHRAMLGNPTF
jgi:hypothetical protein